jgi:hypothetical protein
MATEKRTKRRKRKLADPSQNGQVDDDLTYEHIIGNRTKLIQRIRGGIPPRPYHALSHGILVKGKRHQCVAPYKVGKSIAWQSHLTQVCLEGETVLYIDKENGADEFARRLECFIKAWDLSDEQQEVIEEQFIYIEYPRLRLDDEEALNGLISDYEVDILVLDSQRMVLSDMNLAEDSSDDYGKFMNRLVLPLNCTVLILDNTGWENHTRGRGTSSKGDQNEVLFSMGPAKTFDVNQEGSLALYQEATRFDRGGPWIMTLGGGTYGTWELKEPALSPEELVMSVLPPEGGKVTGRVMEREWAGKGHGTPTLRKARADLIAAEAVGTDRKKGGGRGKAVHFWRVGGAK